MITGGEILKTVILGLTIVYALRMLKRPTIHREIEIIRKL